MHTILTYARGRWGSEAKNKSTNCSLRITSNQKCVRAVAFKHMRITSNQKCVRAQAPYIPVAPFWPAKPAPPKHTSTRHDIDGMNLCSFALHLVLASSSLGRAQSLISGRLDGFIGVLPPEKNISPAATPVVPIR